jgi:hypothetical protein
LGTRRCTQEGSNENIQKPAFPLDMVRFGASGGMRKKGEGDEDIKM